MRHRFWYTLNSGSALPSRVAQISASYVRCQTTIDQIVTISALSQAPNLLCAGDLGFLAVSIVQMCPFGVFMHSDENASDINAFCSASRGTQPFTSWKQHVTQIASTVSANLHDPAQHTKMAKTSIRCAAASINFEITIVAPIRVKSIYPIETPTVKNLQ